MRWLWLPLLAGLSVVDALAQVGAQAELKWPNDVLIDGRKVCGILSERIVNPDAAVIGMGINTRLSVDQLPVPTATSLALAGVEVNERDLAVAVLTALGGWYRRWLDGEDFASIMTQRCGTVGRPVRVELGVAGEVVGEAVGIDSDGCLVVDVDGQRRVFAAGDVVHLR